MTFLKKRFQKQLVHSNVICLKHAENRKKMKARMKSATYVEYDNLDENERRRRNLTRKKLMPREKYSKKRQKRNSTRICWQNWHSYWLYKVGKRDFYKWKFCHLFPKESLQYVSVIHYCSRQLLFIWRKAATRLSDFVTTQQETKGSNLETWTLRKTCRW